jgi:hypothetical protein
MKAFLGTYPMAESIDHIPNESNVRRSNGWAPSMSPSEDHERALSHYANMQLILRRLADEQRTTGWKKWWKSKP